MVGKALWLIGGLVCLVALALVVWCGWDNCGWGAPYRVVKAYHMASLSCFAGMAYCFSKV